MHSESELQIHSDISAALNSNLDASNIEIKHAPDVVFIGRNNYKKFLIGSSISLCFTHLFLLLWSIIFLIAPKRFRVFFRNYEELGNGTDIVACAFLVLSLALLACSRRIARSAFKFVLVIIINVCVAYLSAFLFIVGRQFRHRFADYVHIWYAMIYCGSIGLFVNALIGTKRFFPMRGIPISVCLFIIIDLWIVFHFEQISPYLWEHFIFVAIATLFSCYLNFSAFTMLQRRFDFYLNNDWAIGYSHLQVYFVYHLWHDWVFLKKGKPTDFNMNAENYVPNKSELIQQTD